MQSVESAEVKIGPDTISFEIGDMVSVGNVRESIARLFINDNKEVKIELRGNTVKVSPHAVRFMNSTVDCRYQNALLDIIELKQSVRDAEAHAKKFKALRRTMTFRKNRLEKSKLCKEAIEAQLRSEFQDLYIG